MALAGMIAADEAALICDFAETYGVMDFRSLPVKTAAVLASGLRDTSRVKMKMSGAAAAPDILLLAAAVDRLSLIVWSKTEDAKKDINRPKSLVERLTNPQEDSEEPAGFDTAQEYESAWKAITGGDHYRNRTG